MKKTLLLLVALITATIAFAKTEIDGIYYNLNDETKTAVVTSGGNYSGDITIPEKVTYNSTEYSVTSIGWRAFYNCSSLTSVTIPNSVTSIGFNAFASCPSLTSITIPNSVNSIEHSAFYDCSSLTSINVDSNHPNYTSIDGVLYNKDITTLICCPGGKTSISIPNSVTYIGDAAFYSCSSLTSISIPNSVTSIGRSAFSSCTSLTSITIPNSITSIGDYAFSNTPWLNNQPNGCLYIGKCLYQYRGEMPANTHIDVNEGTTMICGSAFSSCSSLTSITIPNSVTSIGESAFNSCSSLTSISIPNSVTSIGRSAFYGTPWLNNQPDGCLYIGKCLYQYRGEMPENTHIDVNEGTTMICGGAFEDCTSLTSITIPNSVTEIGKGAFSWCSSLTSITCLGSTPPSANDLQAEYETCILFVPKGSLNDYQNHAEWGKFLNIQELESEKYTITTAVNDDAMGSVTEGDEYAYGTEISLTATANSGYRFTQWSDGNTENPRTIIVTENKTYTAEFEVETFTITTASEVPSMGGVEITLTAKPIEGFEFVEWTDGNTDNPRILTLTENIEVYARFQIAQGGNPVNLETSKISSANIYTTNGTLHIEGATENYHILDAAGRLIYSGNASTLTLPRGIYLITIGGKVEKIVL